MTALEKGFEKIVKWSVAATEDKAKLQNVTGAVAWGVSCLAYVGAVALNQNIPADQKKFLIPQEIMDGIINVGLFWSITGKAQRMAEKQLKEGKILPKDLKEEISKVKKEIGENADYKQLHAKLDPKSAKRLASFKTTYPMFISLIGSVLASNIVTPITRNVVASLVQHKATNTPLPARKNIERPSKAPEKPVLNTYQNVRPVSGSSQMRV